jgi:hypothetical protein
MGDRKRYDDLEGAWGTRVPEAAAGDFDNQGEWGTHLRWSRSGESAGNEPDEARRDEADVDDNPPAGTPDSKP